MKRSPSLTGKRFGRWLVVGPPLYQKGRTHYRCRCDCGTTQTIYRSELTCNHSGGCRKCQTYHGRIPIDTVGRFGLSHSEYRVLHEIRRNLLRRCYLPDHVSYQYYGARGVQVCDRWRDDTVGLANFIHDMGPRPSARHSIDRINADGNYEPSNCRWATIMEQRHNRRKGNRQ